MKVAITGAPGFVGSHILTELLGHGHEVLTLVRDEDQADSLTARGAKPIVVDLYDRPRRREPAKPGGRGHPRGESG